MPTHGTVHADQVRDGAEAARKNEAAEQGCEAKQRGGSGDLVGQRARGPDEE